MPLCLIGLYIQIIDYCYENWQLKYEINNKQMNKKNYRPEGQSDIT